MIFGIFFFFLDFLELIFVHSSTTPHCAVGRRHFVAAAEMILCNNMQSGVAFHFACHILRESSHPIPFQFLRASHISLLVNLAHQGMDQLISIR